MIEKELSENAKQAARMYLIYDELARLTEEMALLYQQMNMKQEQLLRIQKDTMPT